MGKAKQKQKVKEEPRPSLFRFLFRTVKREDELPDDLEEIMNNLEADEDGEGGADAEDYLSAITQIASCFNEQIIPFAVRWYTNEADPDPGFDMDDEDEEEEDEDDDDD